jgi:signal transduction histidine kinase
VNPASHPLVAELNQLYPQAVDDEHNLLGRVLRAGTTVLVPVTRRPAGPDERSPHHARLWPVVEALGPRALLGVPLEAHGRVLGALMLAMSESGRPFAEDDLPMLQELARRAAVALDNARLFAQAQRFAVELEQRVADRTAELRASEAALRQSQDRLMQESAARQRAQQQLEHGRETERARIAREVHDELGGTLTALKMGLYRLRRLDSLAPQAQEQIAQLAAEIDDSAQVVRRIAQELRPAVLDDFGLVAALEWQFSEFRKRSGLRGEWRCDLDGVDLPSQAAIACFRIFQEALTNVARHAEASQVQVIVRREADELLLQVADNGRGMPPAGEAAPGRLGLVGMHERAALLAGTLEVTSVPGQGTTVTLRVPLHNVPL